MPGGWPIDEIKTLLKDGTVRQGSSAFKTFRSTLLKAEADEIQKITVDAEIIWEFLFSFCMEKKMFRKQILECVNVLLENGTWAQAYTNSDKLVKMVQDLPADLQAAFAEQSEGTEQQAAIMQSISPAAMQIMKSVAPGTTGEKKEEVKQGVAEFREADKAREAMLKDSEEEASAAPVFGHRPTQPAADAPTPAAQPSGGYGGGAPAQPSGGYSKPTPAVAQPAPAPKPTPTPVVPKRTLTPLSEGIEAVLAITNNVQMENAGVSAFAVLRKGCLHAAGDDEVFEKEADDAAPTLNFLIDFVQKNRLRLRQVLEVLHLLMASEAWVNAYQGSPMLQERVSQELPNEIQAAFGMAHPQIMMSIAPAAQTMVKEKKVDPALAKVKHDMEKLRKGGHVVKEEPAEKKKEDKSTDDDPANWREAKAPGSGATYYYNTKTRESRWTRPECLGGEHKYKVGDEVEVYSNSNKAWGAGKILEVKEKTVVAEFAVPGGNGQMAKKELPSNHQHLRLLDKSKVEDKSDADVALSDEEKKVYQHYFKHCSKGSDAVQGQFFSRFLAHCGLPRRALKEIWSVANPDLKKDLSFDEFSKSCRLVAHGQDLEANGQEKLLVDGGAPLKTMLQSKLGSVPPKMPDFQRSSSSQ